MTIEALYPVGELRSARPSYHIGYGFVSLDPIPLRLDQRHLVAIDFGDDQPINGRLASLDLVGKIGGAGEVTWQLIGVDRQLAKLWLTGTVAGDVELSIVTTDRDGHESDAHVKFMVNN